jgi:glycerol-3-phosphate dehydrogenase
LQSLEPNLNTSAVGAVHIPGEVVLDPWLYSIALAVHARENGAHIFTNFGMDPEASSFDGEVWSVARKKNDIDGTSGISGPFKIRSKAVVSATGLWSDLIQQKMHSSSTWNARPRRGQYRIFSSTDSTQITHPIQPVPTQRTKGIFVFSSLYDQVIVGPTALDQESRTDREVSSGVADELAEVGVRIIPSLDIDKAHVGEYVGIRPGTDKRDYQIHLDYTKRWITAAGIRSTGTCNIASCKCCVFMLFSDAHALIFLLLLRRRTHGESRDRSPCNPFAPRLATGTRTSGFDTDNSVTVGQRVGGRLPPPWGSAGGDTGEII